MIQFTLDTGALIAIERGKARGSMLLQAGYERRARLLAITPVVAEWWRGRTDRRDRIASVVELVPFPVRAAKAAGAILAAMHSHAERTRLTVDVMVMAFAATEGGGRVYTSDFDDLDALTPYFPSVRVLSV